MHAVAVAGGLHRFGECGVLDDGVEQTVQAHEEVSVQESGVGVRGSGQRRRPDTSDGPGGVQGTTPGSAPPAPADTAGSPPPPPLPIPVPWGLPPPDPRIALNALVLKRRTG
ncbi:hypothetical protein GCM10017557_32350 [Streptomyces aurantiacus]|uniref:Uncharacterized protein n=1 Tax=Streptomyces aurantiacus TaxID=47760 RepID=A0A7G1P3J8_9ACTN|nr:hypothetical protein GCM10017557_32350 [Streptomyces aurantiacus]